MRLTDDMIAEMREDLAKANDGGVPVYDDAAVEIALSEIHGLRTRVADLEGEINRKQNCISATMKVERGLHEQVTELQAQLDRATSEAEGLKDELNTAAGYAEGLTASRDIAIRHQATLQTKVEELLARFKCQTCHDKGWTVEVMDHSWSDPEGIQTQVDCPDCTGEPAEPRPMSEAPKGGDEISLVMRAMYVRGMGWVVDRETPPTGWLPTTTAAGGSGEGE